jgi:nicotinate-nucleotide adenylyltransferase
MTAKKIGYLGGTFDPIHFGHLNLAIEALEKGKLDEIWFCPTSQSPHKLNSPPISIHHRLQMAKLALEGYPEFKVLEEEASLGQPHYTYNTLIKLQSDPKNHNKKFYLLFSEDLLFQFHTWYQAEALLTQFPLFVASRKVDDLPSINEIKNPLILKALKEKVEIRTLEINSREIRQRLKNKLYCTHLTPLKVLDYICENGLY